MTKYILHGGFTRVDNEQNDFFFRELVKDVPEDGTVLLVFFAAEDNRAEELFSAISHKYEEQLGGKNVNFILATKETFIEQVKEADGIYLHGGHTPLLISFLASIPNIKELFLGKIIAGSSAGAYALATWGSANSEEHMREGLGILPIRLVCHYESVDLPPSNSSLAELQNTDESLEIVYLKDFETKIIFQ